MDVFGGAPRFLAYPRPVVVQSGTDAVLKCQIGGDPRPAVIWERNNEKIDPQGRYRVFEDGNVYNLIISAVTTEDSGQYICKAKNSIGETYAAATLKVEGEAQEMELREENKPRFLIKPLSTRVGRGEDAVFSCKLWGNPRPEVVWEKDGRKLNEIFESTHFNVGYQDGGWFQLKIFKTRAPDGGVYTCKARNEFGESLAGAVLLVDAGPGHEEEGNLKMFAVTEGKHAKFRCFVTGKPKPEIIWRKDGRLILSGRRYLLYEDREGYFTLKVLYCKQKDNGVYVCAASNTAGQTLSAVHLSVKEPLVRFKQPLIDLEVWERDLAVLECEVPEDSVPITWYLEDRRLQPGAKYGMEEWGTKRRLTIRDIGVDDDGIYLCEMPDGGRSIAEVAVKGTILRKLPRKVDVLEGENAAFCVEVEKEEMDIHWYKDGVELRETHQTIIKSFGRTHILVFVNTMPEDTGLVTFLVGRSKTSSQLRVKAARHCPPSSPVGVQINTERANAALLSWIPAQDSRRNPPSGYVLERQEVGTGSQEWLQCLTTDSATSVEILGDSVPCEADYRFRICSVNKYGKSNNVEFPRAVHLVPVARIQAPLQDALVPEGQDALFSIELSASVIGTWFLNGTQLQEDERFSMRRSRTHQSLRIRGVRDTDNGAEITFIAYGIRDSAALYIQGMSPLVKFSPLSEMDRNKFVEAGNPIVLYCELSDPAAPVHWYKNGVELQKMEGVHIQSEAEFFHSGLYCCKTKGDTIMFNVDIKAPPVKFSAIPEEMRTRLIEAGCPIVLQCVVSDPEAQVCWYKDDMQLTSNSALEINSEGNTRILVVQSAELCHSALILLSCPEFPMLAIPVMYSSIFDIERTKSLEAGKALELECEVADSTVPVCWYKDGVKLSPQNGLDIQSNGMLRRLVIPSAELLHSGLYSCETADDTIHFTVDIKDPVVQRNKSIEAGESLVLQCEISDPNAHVTWYKDEIELHEAAGHDMLAEDSIRTLAFQSVMPSHAGTYTCKTRDDAMQFHVDVKGEKILDVKGQSPQIMPIAQSEKYKMIAIGCPIILQCEVSDPVAQVSWFKDEVELFCKTGLDMKRDGNLRKLIIHSAKASDAGLYCCSLADDVVTFHVDIKEPPVQIVSPSQSQMELCQQTSERMVLSCEISRPNAVVRWYQDGLEVEENDNLILEVDGVYRRLIIPETTVKDSGEYVCDTADDSMTFFVNIAEPPVRFIRPRKMASRVEKVAGESLVLDCEVSRSNAEVTWKKNGKEVEDSRHVTILEDGVIHQLTIHSLTVEDAGQYVCDAKDDVMDFDVKVQEPPVQIIGNSGHPEHHILVAGDDLILECEVSQPNANVQWLWNGEVLQPDTRTKIDSYDVVRKLVISGLQPSDSGKYICDAIDDKLITIVDVQEMKVKFIRPLENTVSLKGSSLTLRCEINKAKGPVQWLKDGQEVSPSNRHTIRAQGRERSFTIHQTVEEDAGEYVCESTDDRTSATVTIEVPRVVEFIAELHSVTVCEGEDAVFKCVVSPEDTELVWQLNDKKLALNERTVISSNGLCHMLCIHNCMVSDSGRVTADTLHDRTQAQLTVEPRKITIKRGLTDVKTTERETTSFEVELSHPNVPGTWIRNGIQLKPTNHFRMSAKGQVHSLTISNLSVEDTGTFMFCIENLKTSARLVVKERELLILQGLDDLDIQEDQNAVFVCEISVEDVPGEWYRNGERIQPTSTIKIRQEGTKHFLLMCNVRPEDSGEIKFVARHVESVAYLEVEELPVNIVKPLQDKTVLEKSRVILDCTVSNPRCSTRWYKGSNVILPSERFEICSEGCYRKLIIQQVALDDEGTYSVQVGEYTCSAKLTVEGKRVRY
uniref:Obscurin-like protein 1 n=1 Tax=Mastacembelus armatus TaxID=205130 RepID=A0A3Q3LTW9_9TELE